MSARRRDVVVITGASSGIGLATALRLAVPGARLVLAGREASTLQRAARLCTDRGAEVLAIPTDVADAEAVDALVSQAVSRFGAVDALVHSAAVLAFGRFTDVPADVFDRVLEVNVRGTANVARSVLPLFADQQHGRLVVLGSVLGKIGTVRMSTYQTSKWAVHGLVRALQVEARHTPGVDVVLVSPGGVDTPIYTHAGNYTGRQGRPPPPVSAPDDVAQAIERALSSPRREVSVGPANRIMVTGFRALPGLYDLLVGPLMDALATSRREVVDGPGNVFDPRPETEALHGRWQQHDAAQIGRQLAGAAGGGVLAGLRRLRHGAIRSR